jgi:hypothetical protein
LVWAAPLGPVVTEDCNRREDQQNEACHGRESGGG